MTLFELWSEINFYLYFYYIKFNLPRLISHNAICAVIFNQSSKDDVVVFGLSTFAVETTIQLKIPSKVPDQRRRKKRTKIKETMTSPHPAPENYPGAPWVKLHKEHPSQRQVNTEGWGGHTPLAVLPMHVLHRERLSLKEEILVHARSHHALANSMPNPQRIENPDG